MTDLVNCSWYVAYRSAVLETDSTRQAGLISEVLKALEERLATTKVYSPEHQAIEHAQRALATFKNEESGRVGFEDIAATTFTWRKTQTARSI